MNQHALILRRSSTHPYAAFEADLPGGIIELDETFEEGLAREVLEETGMIVDMGRLRLLHVSESTSYAWMMYGMQIDVAAPDVTLSWEHDQYTWIPVADVIGLELSAQTAFDYSYKNNLLQLI